MLRLSALPRAWRFAAGAAVLALGLAQAPAAQAIDDLTIIAPAKAGGG